MEDCDADMAQERITSPKITVTSQESREAASEEITLQTTVEDGADVTCCGRPFHTRAVTTSCDSSCLNPLR